MMVEREPVGRVARQCLVAALLVACPTVCRAGSLQGEADRIGLLVGAAVDPSLFSDPLYAATLIREFNLIEPENVMKWQTIEPARGRFDFAAGDQVVAFAEAHRMKVRGHNLLWRIYNPDWLTQGKFTPAELRSIMKNHITAEVEHYRGRVFAWDVVNEAFDSAGQLEPSIWYDRPGIGLADQATEYLAEAFRGAHAADPGALLFYNDYGAEGQNAKSDAIYAMVKDFRQRGVPIDGVGFQMHLSDPHNLPAGVAANFARFTQLGVQVQITEMDVALPAPAEGATPTRKDLAAQAHAYLQMAQVCAEQPGCTAFQTWGFTDGHSWIPAFTHGKKGAALIFDANYRPKPAYRAILRAFDTARMANPEIKTERMRFRQRTTLARDDSRKLPMQ